MTRRTKQIWKGTIAGLAGGLAGSFVMTQFQNLWSKLRGGSANSRDEPATVKVARRIFPVREANKQLAGSLVHYSFGTLNGAAYGAIAEVAPAAQKCAGTLFGAVVFAVADESLVPLLGFSKPPNRYPVSVHLYGLASHLVYGLATDGVRRAIRAAL
jgi:uncharacterized membrane protein YagU involved in acid resistance